MKSQDIDRIVEIKKKRLEERERALAKARNDHDQAEKLAANIKNQEKIMTDQFAALTAGEWAVLSQAMTPGGLAAWDRAKKSRVQKLKTFGPMLARAEAFRRVKLAAMRVEEGKYREAEREHERWVTLRDEVREEERHEETLEQDRADEDLLLVHNRARGLIRTGHQETEPVEH